MLALGAEVLTVGLAFLAWSLWQRFRARLAPGLVLSVSGPVTCYVLRERQTDAIGGAPGTRTGYYLRVAEQEFAVSKAVPWPPLRTARCIPFTMWRGPSRCSARSRCRMTGAHERRNFARDEGGQQ